MCTTRDTVGVITRSVADVKLFDDIFSDCPSPRTFGKVDVKGLRIGIPTPWWKDIGKEVRHPCRLDWTPWACVVASSAV